YAIRYVPHDEWVLKAVLALEAGDRCFGRKVRSVLAPALQLRHRAYRVPVRHRVRRARRARALTGLAHGLRGLGVWQKVRHGASDGLRRVGAEHPLGGAIEQRDALAVVEDNDGIHRGA